MREELNVALIKCPECGREISDSATACPGCGHPMKKTSENKTHGKNDLSERYRKLGEKQKKEKKKGGKLKWIVIAVIVILIIGVAAGSDDNDTTTSNTSSDASRETAVIEETSSETETTIEYITVTAEELSDALYNNAMKAQNDYEGKYLEITGKLGTIDSNGKYIGIDTDSFSLTNIQCYIKTDEQKQVIMEMSRGVSITVKGYCKDIGEILGYQIDIEEVSK